MRLTQKHCVPCEGGTPPLGRGETAPLMSQLDPQWQLVDNLKLRREFKLGGFMPAVKFVNAVAKMAESENHHPNIEIYYNKVVLTLWTHAISGLSENDFILAAKIDQL